MCASRRSSAGTPTQSSRFGQFTLATRFNTISYGHLASRITGIRPVSAEILQHLDACPSTDTVSTNTISLVTYSNQIRIDFRKLVRAYNIELYNFKDLNKSYIVF